MRAYQKAMSFNAAAADSERAEEEQKAGPKAPKDPLVKRIWLLRNEGKTMPQLGILGVKQQFVCNISGLSYFSTDNEERLRSLYEGRAWQAWKKVRDMFAILNAKPQKPGIPGYRHLNLSMIEEIEKEQFEKYEARKKTLAKPIVNQSFVEQAIQRMHERQPNLKLPPPRWRPLSSCEMRLGVATKPLLEKTTDGDMVAGMAVIRVEKEAGGVSSKRRKKDPAVGQDECGIESQAMASSASAKWNGPGVNDKQDAVTVTIDKEFLQDYLNTTTHYGDPKQGCESDEKAVQIQGISGDFCTPPCSTASACPTDVPEGITAKPTCALDDGQGDKYCALLSSSPRRTTTSVTPTLPARPSAELESALTMIK
eukprot:jgi/Bigna1/82184/fgenesh1_pg.89_\